MTTIKIWLKSFIPAHIEGFEYVPGGLHVGKTMISSPKALNLCFLTDQRDFDPSLYAHCRTHSEIEIDLIQGRILNQFHKCDPTIQVDCATGEEICQKPASAEYMKFSDLEIAGDTLRIKLSGSARNGCLEVGNIPIAPSLDYNGTITLHRVDNQTVQVGFDGKIETYPAFEMYAVINGSEPHTIFTAPVVPGATPINLTGGPTRDVKRQVEIQFSYQP
jgi:hypothetical protein